MKPNNGHGVVRALSGRIAAVLLGVVCALCVSATPALAAEGSITNYRTKLTYTDIAKATTEAESGDTLILGEGNYTLYGVSSEGSTKGKNLTFVGQGTDKTAWNIGAEVPNPDNFGTEYNGDYSFDGADTVTFEGMTMRSGSANYLGFIRANKTVLKDCVVNGKTFYWGYESAEFNNTTFNAPSGDYAIWTYSSPTMTFNDCTFNATGKVINVYTDASAGKHDIIVNVNNCTFNSNDSMGKQALNINDSNMGSFKYIIKFKGANTATAKRDITTCSQLFGFGGKPGNNSGRSDVYFGDELVWTQGAMKTHSYTDGQQEDNFVDLKDYVWTQEGEDWYCTGHAKCGYCGWPIEEKVKAEVVVDPATCLEAGKTSYVAKFSHKCFTQQTKSGDAIDPLGHDWDEPEYVWAKQGDDWYCTAKRVCKRDASHVEMETVKATYEVTTPATTKKEGVGTYTATFENEAFETQTKTEAIAKLPAEPSKPSENTQKPAQKKAKSSVPATGDSINTALPVAAAIAGVALVGAVVIRRRNER
ncbi:LPXTG cell wall anchor domain-containing protein [Paratractidigestivibacter faecalis]|uniref:LPXTG cell wall anchor domain-containing protein n=1 Tax=Paratractidigestivibacter faecalis TaxID=2292441 RepID=UPI003D060D7D